MMWLALRSVAYLLLLSASGVFCRQPVQKENQEKPAGEDMDVAATVMDGFDTDKNGKLSMDELLSHVSDAKGELPAEYKGWKDGFKEADLDADGHLTVSELHTLLQSVEEPDKDKMVEESEVSVAEQIMDGMDANKDGHLSLKELTDHVGDESKLHAAFAGWKDGFKEADKDADGLLSVRELGHLLQGVSRSDQHHLVEESEMEVASQVMDGFDKDKNGQISLQELLDHVGDSKELHAAFAGWKEGFAEADANKNGELDLHELSSLLQHVSRDDQHKLVEESEMEVAHSVMAGFDTDKDGEISLKELLDHVGENKEVQAAFQGWQEGFQHADSDGNGRLNIQELATLLESVSRDNQHDLVHTSEREVAAQVMDGFDTDKDGKISLMELLDHLGDKAMHSSFEGWRDGFKQADADKDQHLDLDELTTLLEHVSREDQDHMVEESELETAAQILEGFDTNKNGKISLKELQDKVGDEDKLHVAFKGWREGFAEADGDQDGELNVEELATLLQHVSRDEQHELVDQSEEEIAESIMDGFDANKDGFISLQELKEKVGDNPDAAFEGWQEGFLEADIDQDGQLNVHELAGLLKHVSRKDQHEMVEQTGAEISASVMDGFDTNKDGKISMQELLDHTKGKEHVEAAFDGWKDGFKDADSDNDGHLNMQELTTLLNRVSRGTQHELVDESEESIAESVMKGWDSNKDGVLTLAELQQHVGDNEEVHAAFKGWKEGFDLADANKDGHLTIAELSSLLKRVSTKDQHKIVQDVDETTASLLQGFDSDRDGKVSLEEILKHVEKMGTSENAANMISSAKEGFVQADADKDGGLDAKELAALLHKLNESPTKHDEM